ncbi:DUF883 domain-containing protein [uncultured Roseobacter sp.]|uniref:DUF883 family protein n=1 Tax=uncultured Roseobacter sp. TaxID=114847 RepID=UPI0026317D4A|nr:DUF883 domain-containing protein [uncultured Roseobacter sp.]
MAQARTNGKTELTDVTAQIDTIKQDIAALTNLMADLAKDKTDEAKKRAAGSVKDMSASAEAAAKTAQAKASDTAHQIRNEAEMAYLKAEDTVRQQPAMSVGIAAGVGFLVGLLAARRH